MCSPWDGPSESALNAVGMAAGVCCAADTEDVFAARH